MTGSFTIFFSEGKRVPICAEADHVISREAHNAAAILARGDELFIGVWGEKEGLGTVARESRRCATTQPIKFTDWDSSHGSFDG